MSEETTAMEAIEAAAPTTSITPQMSRDQIELIKRTICRDATDDELQLFLHRCRTMGLDPFSGQIKAMRLWQDGEKKLVIVTGIDGFWLIAERTGERDGMEGPFWCGPDGEWKDIWLEAEPPRAAKVLIYRKGTERAYPGKAYWDFFCGRKKNGEVTQMWTRGGPHILAKCACGIALRAAFPNELGGMYSFEEMQQANNPDRPADIAHDDDEALGLAMDECETDEEVVTYWPSVKRRKGERYKRLKKRFVTNRHRCVRAAEEAEAPPPAPPDDEPPPAEPDQRTGAHGEQGQLV